MIKAISILSLLALGSAQAAFAEGRCEVTGHTSGGSCGVLCVDAGYAVQQNPLRLDTLDECVSSARAMLESRAPRGRTYVRVNYTFTPDVGYLYLGQISRR